MVIQYEWDYDCDLNLEDKECIEGVEMTFGKEGTDPGDYLYIYEHKKSEADQVKLETAQAYDKVGETAHLEGNIKKAQAIMQYLGYTDGEFEWAGKDAYNYQGVGNPHIHAKIQPGEKVLDLGSGLGVDSIIASHYAGEKGRVIGLDLSSKEVLHATKRAEARGANIKYVNADMEAIPLPDDTIDVVISNGAFCLAPDKEKAFREIYRVLRPGGRMSVCTSTVKLDL